MADGSSPFTPQEDRAFAKVSRRVLWFLFALTVINYLDRTNVGIAQLTMGRDLGISASVFGLSVTIFSIVYALLEIPSNLALQTFGARIWLARIMITWGIASAGCALAMGPASFLTLRSFVGAAEAGFVPGLVLYLTYWYPQYYRARAQSSFMIAQPVALALGSVVGGFILQMNGVFNIAGWRWLFLIEGFPAIILGVAILYYLADRPATAAWLDPQERALVEAAVKRDAEQREASGPTPDSSLRGQARHVLGRNMLIISLAYFTLIGNFSAAGYWTPQIVRSISSPNQPFWLTGIISGGPYIFAIAAIPLWSAFSDRIKERYWTAILPMVVAGCGWLAAALLHSGPLQYAGLVVASVASLSVWSLFFTMPSAIIPRTAHAAGIAFMNTIGMCGASVAPLVMGILKDRTGGFTAPMTIIGIALIVGGGVMLLVPRYLLVGDGVRETPVITPAPGRA
jgi:ACS family 4-hydroxyphenylacetate permease-like MFS transporter